MRTAVHRPWNKQRTPWTNRYRVTIEVQQQSMYEYDEIVTATTRGQAIQRAITGLKTNLIDQIVSVHVEEVDRRVPIV